MRLSFLPVTKKCLTSIFTSFPVLIIDDVVVVVVAVVVDIDCRHKSGSNHKLSIGNLCSNETFHFFDSDLSLDEAHDGDCRRDRLIGTWP